ncbi:MAG: PKD domain-containing protein [Bacteriovorax sp.]|nr:PKD domain-containing protein [Bacteriovorax sp.]
MFQIQAIVLGFILSLTQASFAGTREFSVDKAEGISPLTITFNASSIKSAKKFIWVFGDGNNLTTTNPTVTYQYKTPGTFTAALSYQVNASDKNPNYKDAGSVTITVLNQLPKVVLNCSSSKPRSLECSASGSKDNDGSIISYQYAWDDGKSDLKSDDSLIAHAFLAGGTHVVTVTATDNSGGSSKVTQSFVVKENTNPIANFTCTSSIMLT